MLWRHTKTRNGLHFPSIFSSLSLHVGALLIPVSDLFKVIIAFPYFPLLIRNPQNGIDQIKFKQKKKPLSFALPTINSAAPSRINVKSRIP